MIHDGNLANRGQAGIQYDYVDSFLICPFSQCSIIRGFAYRLGAWSLAFLHGLQNLNKQKYRRPSHF